MKGSRRTRENLDLLYTLDPQDTEVMENCNTEQRERMKRYIKAVMETALTERQRQIVRMYHGEGLSTPEIARIIGVSPRAVQLSLEGAMIKIGQHKKIFLKSEAI